MQKFHTVEVIHQVLIVDGYQIPEHLPAMVSRNAAAARHLYPDARYKLWSGNDLREFLRDSFDHDVLLAFDTLTPYSYKCDLARFCLLYVYGGLYLDLAIRLMNVWKIPNVCGVAAFTEMYPGMESWTATQTSLLWSLPGRPEWKQAIEWIVENCRTRFYGPHDHYPTAGALLGRSFAAAMAAKGQSSEADDQWVGACRYVTPENKLQNVCYVGPDRLLVGLRTKLISGDLTEMGLAGTNNYLDIWKRRQVYGESKHIWNFDDALIRVEDRAAKTTTGIRVHSGTTGRVMYGPFVNLDPGTYQLEIAFGPATTFSSLFVDVSARYGSDVLTSRKFEYGQPGLRGSVSLEFTLHAPTTEVEFRMSVFGDFDGELVRVTLTPRVKRSWTFDNEKIGLIGAKRTERGIFIPRRRVGRVLYGPYADIEAGRYTLYLHFTSDTRFGRLRVEVCGGEGNEILQAFDHRQSKRPQRDTLEFDLELKKSYPDVEFRIEVFGDFEGHFRAFVLQPVKLMADEKGGEVNQQNGQFREGKPRANRKHTASSASLPEGNIAQWARRLRALAKVS